jgi:beta-1,4-mannosyl-glycoprotein beta-1,4-N-acetylglucosaminyltransferase
VRNAMMHCVGRQVLQSASPRFARRQGRRVFNVLPFNNESMLLKMRLYEMGDWVDQFVVIESRLTFTGLPKPLHFDPSDPEIQPHAHKLRHVVIDEFPPFANSPWGRDFYQRDWGVTALYDLWAEDDLVLLTDADEIVRRNVVEAFEGEFANLRMETYRYFLNNRFVVDRQQQKGTGAIARARHLAEHGSSYLRFVLSQYDPARFIFDAGWHFTSVFQPEQLAEKQRSFAHQEYKHRNQKHYQRLLADLRAGRVEPGWARAPIDESLPAYVTANREALAEILLEASELAPAAPI